MTHLRGPVLPLHRPTNVTVDRRRAENWPTARGKARWRQKHRRLIARAAQRARDRAAAQQSY